MPADRTPAHDQHCWLVIDGYKCRAERDTSSQPWNGSCCQIVGIAARARNLDNLRVMLKNAIEARLRERAKATK